MYWMFADMLPLVTVSDGPTESMQSINGIIMYTSRHVTFQKKYTCTI